MKASVFSKYWLILAVFLLIFNGINIAGEDILTGSDLLKSLRKKPLEDTTPAEPNSQPQKPDVNDTNIPPAVPAAAEIKPPEPKPQISVQKPQTKSQKVFNLVPADSLFCIRINNLDYTAGIIDRLLADISPIPLGISILVRAQLAGLLGSPELAGLNTSGSFAVFATAAEQNSENQKPDMFIGVLAPVTDYGRFISDNPNCTQPDANGISKITTRQMPQMPAMLAAKAGHSDYVLVGTEQNYDKLLSSAKSISAEDYSSLAEVLSTSDSRAGQRERIWLYVNLASAAKFSADFGPAWLKQQQSQMESGDFNDAQLGQSVATGKAVIDANEITAGGQSLVLTITPKSNLLRARVALSAVPGSKLASDLSEDSEQMAEFLKTIGAKKPEELSGQMEAISLLISRAARADFVGTYDLINLFRAAAAQSGYSLPQINTAGKSTLVYAGRFYKNKIAVDIAVPKENLANLLTAAQAMQQQALMEKQQQAMQQQALMESQRQEMADDVNLPKEPNAVEDANSNGGD